MLMCGRYLSKNVKQNLTIKPFINSSLNNVKNQSHHIEVNTKGGEHKMALIQDAMGTAIAAVLIAGVGIPVTQEAIETSNLSGITATVVGFVPVGLGASLLMASFSSFLRR